ncbi:MAG: ABC transporter permease, partial [Chloroflexota bacterium]|nr:ABC transporter permease [Chloroflexota bacterium]
AGVISHYGSNDQELVQRLKPPTGEHFLGTDQLGRDVFTRVMYGGRYSLTVGIVTVAAALTVGSTLGLLAGFAGGRTDAILMRSMDVLLAFPGILLAIAIVSTRGPGLGNTMLAVAIVNIPIYARLVRSTTLSVVRREYVTAARTIGVSNLRLMFRHVLPNCYSPLVVQATLGIGTAILDAAGLGFLGLGAQPPTPEWGAMLAGGYQFLINAPWAIAAPGGAIALTVLGFNLFGDGLRDALDPQLRV